MNYESQPLQMHEREAMRADDDVVERVVQSYRMMLDFYGMQLKDTETGLLARAEPERKWTDQYRHLTRTPFYVAALSPRRADLNNRVLSQLPAHFTDLEVPFGDGP